MKERIIRCGSSAVCGNGLAFRQSSQSGHWFLPEHREALWLKTIYVFAPGGKLLSEANGSTSHSRLFYAAEKCGHCYGNGADICLGCLKMPPVFVYSPWWPAVYSGSRFWSPVWSCRTAQSFPPGAAGTEHRDSLSQILRPKHTHIPYRRHINSGQEHKPERGSQRLA